MITLNEIKRRAAQGSHKYSWEDLKRLRAEDEARQDERFRKQFHDFKAERTFSRCGVLPIHQNCRVENFELLTQGHRKAADFARWYIDNFYLNNGTGFIFGGQPGAGKNHLAAAICNELMVAGYSCLVITVNELMQKLRACYKASSEVSEDQFLRTMVDFDLLVLDEVGLQRNSDAERLVLNQIVDQRTCRFKPTGMLTNLPAGAEAPDTQTINSVLGVRIMDRMRANGGKWISFQWESYRK
ncbi:DNA replication protein DnaC [Vibrio ruber DSM 16370]|uniref:DNA replication protein DnaC n=1 Tax=Vibrio ruber (strain DSM 16370 / JCM 11486 / BCRC 17186 / CECT 7878 / LMG 23124 / VR1) TaxID=1123498 RepID=A0A1R4LR11_VIBR1|nr:ATP-binding protein [Vibrio ruber]SJN58893.1 DNA replication protein DnaC [Vibrio ruber DSM 16370]